MAADADVGGVRQVSIAFAWSREGILYTLSLAGRADLVAGLLSEASQIVDPATEAASWIGAFNDALRARVPTLNGLSDWEAGSPFRGRLSVPRSGEAKFAVHGSDELLEGLLGEGFALSTGGRITMASELPL
ncbi:MAG: hypothetical protein DI570_19600 [Phenylobacterium zucineum]|nr:MAG: hypothetical protein DI570_19600 [Phenylobacterium zucineum]